MMKKPTIAIPNRLPVLLSSALLLLTLIPCIFVFWGCSSNIPQSLKDLERRNPEAAAFVAAYPEEHGKHHDIDLSADYTPGKIPLLLQWDIRWGYETYGDNMMALTGCGPTCLSMVAVGLTGDTSIDPLTVAKFADANGYYCTGSGSYWTLMSEGCRQFGLTAEELPLDETTIRSRLSAGQPIICAVGEGDFTTTGHFIVLNGIYSDGTIDVNDPNSPKRSRQGWELQRIMSQVQNLWAFSAN